MPDSNLWICSQQRDRFLAKGAEEVGIAKEFAHLNRQRRHQSVQHIVITKNAILQRGNTCQVFSRKNFQYTAPDTLRSVLTEVVSKKPMQSLKQQRDFDFFNGVRWLRDPNNVRHHTYQRGLRARCTRRIDSRWSVSAGFAT